MKQPKAAARRSVARTRALAVLGLWAVLAGLAWWFAAEKGWTAEQLGRTLVELLAGSVWGPLIYIVLYVARLALLFSATVLTLAGGFLFGPVHGTLLTVLAANLSSLVAYVIGRYFGGASLGARAEEAAEGRLARWRSRMVEAPFETVLIMRLIYLPYDGVSILAGLLALPPRAFLAATILGTLPGTVQFVLLGASLESFRLTEPKVNVAYLAASLVLAGLGLLLSRWLRARSEVDSSHEEGEP
jgi:uncharacterized membrane protein YdjX (TVP38/TMEM64 family)